MEEDKTEEAAELKELVRPLLSPRRTTTTPMRTTWTPTFRQIIIYTWRTASWRDSYTNTATLPRAR